MATRLRGGNARQKYTLRSVPYEQFASCYFFHSYKSSTRRRTFGDILKHWQRATRVNQPNRSTAVGLRKDNRGREDFLHAYRGWESDFRGTTNRSNNPRGQIYDFHDR